MNSLGDLVDKLSIVNIKLWFVQGQIMKAALEDRGASAVTVKQQVQLNAERCQLMGEVDRLLNDSIRVGSAPEPPRIKIP